MHREIGLTLGQMLKDVSPYLLLSVLLTAGTYCVARPLDSLYLRLLLSVLLVAGLYALVLWRWQSVIFRETLQFLFRRGKGGGL